MELLTRLIQRFEHCILHVYLCPAGVPTQGWGSTGPDIRLGGPEWSQQHADDRMANDAGVFYHGAEHLCPNLEGDQVAAIADFAYNVGLTRLAGSTLRRKLNKGDIPGAKRELLKWVRGGGRVLPGLIVRRQAEAALL